MSYLIPLDCEDVTVQTREKAKSDHPGDLGAPMSGVVVEVRVKEGTRVMPGDPVCTLSALKMETIVTAQSTGTVQLVAVKEGDSLSAGDLIVRLVKE